jgi:uncharacterized damage-inducible protein DinB
MNPQIAILKTLLTKTFEKDAWHGPTVMEVLADIDEKSAQFRLLKTHSIIELVTHMTAWRIFVVKKLQGDRAYMVSDSMNFPEPTGWLTVLKELKQSQAALLKELDQFSDSKLDELMPHDAYKCTFSNVLHGIIHHDLYHIGQIALIKKSLHS